MFLTTIRFNKLYLYMHGSMHIYFSLSFVKNTNFSQGHLFFKTYKLIHLENVEEKLINDIFPRSID